MISLDTNILVRILVADDPKQTRKVIELIRSLDKNGEEAHVSDIVLCELVWVLHSGYGHDREAIAAALTRLLAAKQLRFEFPEKLLRALRAYEKGKGDFADYLIREHARSAGCNKVVTFDKKLLKDEMFSSI